MRSFFFGLLLFLLGLAVLLVLLAAFGVVWLCDCFCIWVNREFDRCFEGW